MNAFKELFHRNKKLAEWWTTVAHDERFQQVLMHVRSEFLDFGLDGASLRGAKLFERTLTTIGDNEETPLVYPTPELDHDVDSPRTETHTSNPKKKA